MANIDDELTLIRDASKGEEVRKAIIDAIRKIYDEKEYPPSTLKVTTNGTYDNSVWNKVIVDVPGGGNSEMNFDDVGTIKDNGYYTPEILYKYLGKPAPGNGIAGFYVDVPQNSADLGEIVITENGTYDPLLDGYDGYSKVYVNVMGGEGKPGDMCDLRFFDSDGTLIAQKSAPYGSDFVPPTNIPSSGGTFGGWNPTVTQILRDQDFYATYVTPSSAVGDTINDSWQVIINNMKAKQRKYPVGSIKSLILPIGRIVQMVLIGYNLDISENKSAVFSTWISKPDQTNGLKRPASSTPTECYGNLLTLTTCTGNASVWTNDVYNNHPDRILEPPVWNNSLWRAFLNENPNELLYSNDLLVYTNKTYSFPLDLNTAAGCDLWGEIKPVRKYHSFVVFNSQTPGNNATIQNKNLTSIDKIWFPSIHETGDAPGTLGGMGSTSGVTYGINNILNQALLNDLTVSKNMTLRDELYYNHKSGLYKDNNTLKANDSMSWQSGGEPIVIGFCI